MEGRYRDAGGRGEYRGRSACSPFPPRWEISCPVCSASTIGRSRAPRSAGMRGGPGGRRSPPSRWPRPTPSRRGHGQGPERRHRGAGRRFDTTDLTTYFQGLGLTGAQRRRGRRSTAGRIRRAPMRTPTARSCSTSRWSAPSRRTSRSRCTSRPTLIRGSSTPCRRPCTTPPQAVGDLGQLGRVRGRMEPAGPHPDGADPDRGRRPRRHRHRGLGGQRLRRRGQRQHPARRLPGVGAARAGLRRDLATGLGRRRSSRVGVERPWGRGHRRWHQPPVPGAQLPGRTPSCPTTSTATRPGAASPTSAATPIRRPGT